MQNYQQYLSLPPHLQLPPLATTANQHQKHVTAPGEIGLDGNSVSCNLLAPGFITIKPPTSMFYQVHPNNYVHGLNSSGKIIGTNQEIPYPMPNKKYHDIRFSRAVDWFTTEVLGGASFSDVMKKREACLQKDTPVSQTETAEYFTAANDEGYRSWVAKKVKEREKQTEKQAQMRVIPPEIKALPGHVNPTITETSNEVYGQHIDLRPKYPAMYPLPAKVPAVPMQVLVKFRHSNMSDQPLIPDHSFAVDPQEMINKDGCYTRGIQGSVYYAQGAESQPTSPFTFRSNEVILGQTVGERSKGFTWPLYAPTGLEINRPVSRCVSVVAGVDGVKKFRTLIPARCVPYIYNRYTSFTAIPCKDPATEPNPATRQHKQLCVPFAPHASTNPQCDPCNIKLINPQLLPVPVELRKPPTC